MNFENDITVLVGENDSGKTSIIDAIKIVFGEIEFGQDDFSYGEIEASIKVKIKNKYYIKKIKLNDDEGNNAFIKLNKPEIDKIKAEISSASFDSLDEEAKRQKLFEFFGELCINPGNMRRPDTLTDKINGRISELEMNDYTAPIDRIPTDYNIFFLDGKYFQNIDEHIDKLYFNQIKQDIWKEKVEGESIENIIDNRLKTFTENLETKMKEQGSIDKLKAYLPNITSIKIIPDFTRRLTMGVKVKLLEGEKDIPVEKKGDGTKRRITMALLEIKKEIDDEQSDAYIFDEPNTHLHVKAELDLLEILWGFVEKEKQVIITTHSPFILNSVSPQKIRLLTLNNNRTEIREFKSDEEFESVLNSLGISNTKLFFSKKTLIVEGRTEFTFIPIIFQKIYGFNLENILINIIDGKGIETAVMAARVFRDFNFVDKNDIYVLIDNDGSKKLKRYVEDLDIPKENKREIGHKEFEDTFEPLVVYEAWKEYVKLDIAEDKPEVYEKFKNTWFYETIKILREECIKKNLKFSEKLADYSRECCHVPMDKTDLAIALAKRAEKRDLDPKINYIFNKLLDG